ncbi:hypothetical protein [Mangrovibacillus cuniculi]|uniref:Uncharacterized protein n=1 Tax=Mangrovibacillus cuniculi TaxID=2593652 RepID=A0A7S8CA17_9BACI|nr:hypothetical protein [Mangrovibacillus cuniculi]QPC46122.1 hypothetical protein G8O30_03685 [Mangrovibacillus cuniculi]
MRELTKLEAVLWSIALPGFAQLLARSYIKGLLFVILEFLINVQSDFNLAIMHSFLGETRLAMETINVQWLMFYPCLYMFAMWDAYKIALKKEEPYIYLPFAFSAYLVTIGLMYSPKLTIFGFYLGPIFSGILFVLPGVLIGQLIRTILLKRNKLDYEES